RRVAGRSASSQQVRADRFRAYLSGGAVIGRADFLDGYVRRLYRRHADLVSDHLHGSVGSAAAIRYAEGNGLPDWIFDAGGVRTGRVGGAGRVFAGLAADDRAVLGDRQSGAAANADVGAAYLVELRPDPRDVPALGRPSGAAGHRRRSRRGVLMAVAE